MKITSSFLRFSFYSKANMVKCFLMKGCYMSKRKTTRLDQDINRFLFEPQTKKSDETIKKNASAKKAPAAAKAAASFSARNTERQKKQTVPPTKQPMPQGKTAVQRAAAPNSPAARPKAAPAPQARPQQRPTAPQTRTAPQRPSVPKKPVPQSNAAAKKTAPPAASPALTPEMIAAARRMAREKYEKEMAAKRLSSSSFREQLARAEAAAAREKAAKAAAKPMPAPPRTAEVAPPPAKHNKSEKKKLFSRKAEKKQRKERDAGAPAEARPTRRLQRFKDDLRHPIAFIKRIFTKPNPDYDPNAGDYVVVRGKKRRNRPRVFSVKYAFRNMVVAGLALFLIFFVYAAGVIALAPKIDPNKIYDEISASSIIYDESGKEIESVNTGQNRTIIDYKDLPDYTVNAFIALEDKTFREHHGFNWKRMFGAVLSSFSSGSISGTSTITQQLARNVYLPKIKSQRSIRRKILEMYYASRIESTLSKEKIFAAYVNSIYYGFGCYGIENASQTYFSKSVKDLTLEESAALAAMPQSPDTYALLQSAEGGAASSESATIIKVGDTNYVANDISKSRRQICLDLMLAQGYLKKEEHDAAYDRALTDFLRPTIHAAGTSGTSYFTDYTVNVVIRDLQKEYDLDYNTAYNMVCNGGLRIDSTLNTDAQKAVEAGFSDASNFPSLTNLNKDASGNIVSESGNITLYAYENLIENGNFVLRDGEYRLNDDGSLTIYKNKRLNIYKTEVNGGTDYSLEFKPSYTTEGKDLYIYPGGYVNLPANSKSLDKKGNLVISSSYVKKNSDLIATVDGNPAFTDRLYTMQNKVIQPQGAMVITEVGTGEVKAMVGGRGVSGRQLYNRAINNRQPGSSIKPLAIYSAALQKSHEYGKDGKTFPLVNPGNDTQGTRYYGDYLTAASVIVDEPITIDGKKWPKNSNNSFAGPVTMRKGMQNSINVVAVKIYEQIGAEYAADMVEKFGISTLDRKGSSGDMNPAALALGGLSNGVSPYEMAEAYATFPNGGVRVENRVYREVRDREGKVILKTKKTEHNVLNEGVAYIMTSMLQSVVSGGTGSNAALSGVSVGGKTGTTENNYDIWFNGFTPKYAAALWIGTDVNIALTSSSSAATALWGKIMRRIPNATKGAYKPAPRNIVKKRGEYFTEGTEVA